MALPQSLPRRDLAAQLGHSRFLLGFDHAPSYYLPVIADSAMSADLAWPLRGMQRVPANRWRRGSAGDLSRKYSVETTDGHR